MKQIALLNRPGITAPLDPDVLPAVCFNRNYVQAVRASERFEPLVLGLERANSLQSRQKTIVRPEADEETLGYFERTVKFLIWAAGALTRADDDRWICQNKPDWQAF